ncbi:hypothetical protein P7K49_022225, partial [Saguinus oedipus]
MTPQAAPVQLCAGSHWPLSQLCPTGVPSCHNQDMQPFLHLSILFLWEAAAYLGAWVLTVLGTSRLLHDLPVPLKPCGAPGSKVVGMSESWKVCLRAGAGSELEAMHCPGSMTWPTSKT